MSKGSGEAVDLNELCSITLLPVETIYTIVELGIIEPEGNVPEQWRFTTAMIATTRRAMRLHCDLDIDWPGIALALSLIDELEKLRESNRCLQQRLQRFVESN
ncbi:MAG: chaperone modulatory protein CbpM [Pseudomonadales bacterium]|nr:chaperone modulatory protein CbpM [Gammaproteobacteria bacterium]NNL57488.1 chaperone modulatory protein CbpM [Pseudomonadales bacterium]